jgi:hypothetical protein
MVEDDVYKTALQRAGWALPTPFLHIHSFKKSLGSRRACACSEAGFGSQNGDRA